jgi:formate hydrogenlyase subunit 3/multisubunit Na+/H+ antiporter MnhD subunit
MSPLIPLGILLVGTGLLFVSLLPRFAYPAPVMLGTSLFALVSVATLFFWLPASAALSEWPPAGLFSAGLVLTATPLRWLLAVCLVALTLAAALTGLARPGGPRVTARGSMLLLTFGGLAALLADNVVTLIMAWAGLDFVYFLILILVARGEGVQPQAVLHLTFNSLGTLGLTAAAIFAGPVTSLSGLMSQPTTALLATVAAAFRLGLFPLHLGLPVEVDVRQGLGVLLRLVPPLVAFAAVAELAQAGFPEAVRPWLTAFGVLAMVAGAVQLWLSDSPRQGLTYIVIAQSGLALLVGLWAGPQAAMAVTLQGGALVLGGGLLYLANGFDERQRLWTVFSGVGAATLLGLPLTAGQAGNAALYTAWLASGDWRLWLALAGVLFAQAVLAGGLWRVLFWPGDPIEDGVLGSGGYGVGLGLLAALAIGLGLGLTAIATWTATPGASSWQLGAPENLTAAALALIIAAAGFGLWRFERLTRPSTETASAWLTSFLRLDWLYRLGWGVVRGVETVAFNVAAVLEGEGALLWAIAAVVALVLVLVQ